LACDRFFGFVRGSYFRQSSGCPMYSFRISLATGGHPEMNMPQFLCFAVQFPMQRVPSGRFSCPFPMAMVMSLSAGVFEFCRSCSACCFSSSNNVDWHALHDCLSRILNPSNSMESFSGGRAKGSLTSSQFGGDMSIESRSIVQ